MDRVTIIMIIISNILVGIIAFFSITLIFFPRYQPLDRLYAIIIIVICIIVLALIWSPDILEILWFIR